MMKILIPCLTLFCSALSFFSPASFALASAQLSALSEEPYWLKLGHYRTAILNPWKSEVDDERFFLSNKGKTDPLAELESTISAFNRSVYIDEPSAKNEIYCRFPARYTWLKNKVENNWPEELACNNLDVWRQAIDPEGITLVFPTAFMNSASSMFGHTLLRIDAKDKTRGKDLIAFAVNFAAEPDVNDNAAMYALKGIVGSYPGKFTVMPYYRKVREYSYIESRDIWEYKLNLSSDEVERVMLHLWELQQATFDYYFIDENCSYQLLSLIQLARDDLDLTSQFNFNVIPSDTVAALRDSQLLQSPKYRPAVGTKLFNYSEQLSDKELSVVKRIIEDVNFGAVVGVNAIESYTIEKYELGKYTPTQSAAMLEMAYAWLNFDFNDQGLSREKIAPQLKNLLVARSKIKQPSPFSVPIASVSPENGHSSARVGLSIRQSALEGATVNNEEKTEMLMTYRLAYHDLLDRSAGFIPGAQISFFDLAIAVDTDLNSRVERLYLLDAIALAPDNRIFNSWSWNMRTGFDRQPAINKLVGRYFTQGGYGKSFGDPNHLQTYILGSVEVNGGDITNKVHLGAGTEFGAIWQIEPAHKVAISGNVMALANAEVDYHTQIQLAWHWAPNHQWGLRTELTHKKWYQNHNDVKLTAFYYF